jgi:hypothetical protein
MREKPRRFVGQTLTGAQAFADTMRPNQHSRRRRAVLRGTRNELVADVCPTTHAGGRDSRQSALRSAACRRCCLGGCPRLALLPPARRIQRRLFGLRRPVPRHEALLFTAHSATPAARARHRMPTAMRPSSSIAAGVYAAGNCRPGNRGVPTGSIPCSNTARTRSSRRRSAATAGSIISAAASRSEEAAGWRGGRAVARGDLA